MENSFDLMSYLTADFTVKIISAIVILIVGRLAAGISRKIVKKILSKADTESTIVSFVGSLIYVLLLTFTILAALSKIGVETTSIIAILGAVGFAVGFALQGSLANFAAGFLILVFKYYKVGDYINAAGVSGTVKEIKLFSTVLATPDNVKIMVPSGKIFGDIITNYSVNDTRRINLEIGIGYSSSIDKAIEILAGLLKDDNRILTDPKPDIAVAELADSSVNLIVRPWVKRGDYWAVKCDLMKKIKTTFDENNIEIPFPQMAVHMTQES